MADWGAALQALGQGFLKLPAVQQDTQDRKRLKIEQQQADELHLQRLADLAANRQQRTTSEAREQQQFDAQQSNALASGTRLGESYLLDDPTWQMIQKGAGKTLFEGVRGNPVAADPIKGAIPFLPSEAAGQTLGDNAPVGDVTGMRRVPNMTEKLQLEEARINARAAADANLNEHRKATLDQGDRRIDTQLQIAQDRYALAQRALAQAKASGDANRQLSAQTAAMTAGIALANLQERARPEPNRYTGAEAPGGAAQTSALHDTIKRLMDYLPPPGGAQGGVVAPKPTGATPTPAPTPASATGDIPPVVQSKLTYLNSVTDPAELRDAFAKFRSSPAYTANPNDPTVLLLDAAFKQRGRQLKPKVPNAPVQ